MRIGRLGIAALVVAVVSSVPSRVLAQDKANTTAYPFDPLPLDSKINLKQWVNEDSATLKGVSAGLELTAATLKANFPNSVHLDGRDTYVLIHLLRWSDPVIGPPAFSQSDVDAKTREAAAAKSDVDAAASRLRAAANDANRQALTDSLAEYDEVAKALAEMSASVASAAPRQSVEHANWYVFGGDKAWTLEDFTTAHRTFGVRRMWVLYVHLNLYAPSGATQRIQTYHPIYTVTDTPKTPAPLQHFALLAQLFPDLAKLAPGGAPPTTTVWGGGEITVRSPSDVNIVATLKADDPANPTKNPLPLGSEIKIDNEGRYRFDFGIGVPIRSVKDLTKDDELDAIAPKVITTANAFATIDFYFRPVDVKDPGVRRLPHLVGGVSLTDTEHPFQTYFVGVGWGPAIANFYVGWLRLKLTEKVDGQSYRNDVTVGVELPLVNNLLKRLQK